MSADERTTIPIDELRALVEADTLHLLPVTALVATIRNLAEHLLAATDKDELA